MCLVSCQYFSGYMAPEYAIDGQFSVKSDVFSFGILLMELISGKRSRGFYDPDDNLNLIGYVSMRHRLPHLPVFDLVTDKLIVCLRHGGCGKPGDI